MINVRFIDPVNYKVYDSDVLLKEPLGGTEATVTRVAGALASKYLVKVYQRGREAASSHNRVIYDSLMELPIELSSASPGVSIVLRDIQAACSIKVQYPNEQVYCWLHDLQTPTEDSAKAYLWASEIGVEFICVSDFHKGQASYVRQLSGAKTLPVHVIYNPVMAIKTDLSTKDKSSLLFFSSPHKGLQETVDVFKRFKDFPELKDFKLSVANPGYYPLPEGIKQVPGVTVLGPLRHQDMMNYVSSAFAILHLNSSFPETFGLVHAEAMALGTPVITSSLGANPEILNHPHFMTDVRNVKGVINKLIDWVKHGPPKAKLNPKFEIDAVSKEWDKLIHART